MNNPIEDKKRSYRVGRGGSCYNRPKYVRTSLRYRHAPAARRNNLGFRIVRNKQ